MTPDQRPKGGKLTFPPEQAVAILGTSRARGNTRAALESLIAGRPVEVVDLSDLDIGVYDYAHRNEGDRFIPFVESAIARPLWIFATPVYWYTMSAQTKVFFDRLSDLITIRKDLGRLLRGKSLAVVSTGTDPELPPGFELPFRLTGDYLGMAYAGAFYWQFDKDDVPMPQLAAHARDAATKWLS